MMYIELINGRFSSEEAINIITRMINVKIKYHEKKVSNSTMEEDIKMRELRIIELQKQLYKIRDMIGDKREVEIHANLGINETK